jgi:hypothetical protein
MIRARLALSLAFTVLAFSAASAQPTCFTNYTAEYYCEYARRGKIIAVAQVETLVPAEKYSLLRYKAATLKVIHTLKGSLPKTVTINLPPECAGSIGVGGVYIFNIDPATGNGGNPSASNWLQLDTLNASEAAQVVDDVVAIVAGKRLPALTGRIARPDGAPFANIKVNVVGKDKTYSTTTDAEGNYLFETLPEGEYKASVEYPQGYAPSNDYNRRRDTDVRNIEVSNNPNMPCGTKLEFHTSLSAKLTVKYDAGESGFYPSMQLVDASKRISDDDIPPGTVEGFSDRYERKEGAPEYKFFHVPPGKYLLKLSFERYDNPLTTYYYPAARSVRGAEVLQIGLGTDLKLELKPPALGLITISGKMQLPDGTPLFGGVQLVDVDFPTVSQSFSPADRDRDDIKFVFTSPRGRPIYLCAAYDGAKNGRQIRAYTKLRVDPQKDHEDLTLVLDRTLPNAVRWWDQCRIDP